MSIVRISTTSTSLGGFHATVEETRALVDVRGDAGEWSADRATGTGVHSECVSMCQALRCDRLPAEAPGAVSRQQAHRLLPGGIKGNPRSRRLLVTSARHVTMRRRIRERAELTGVQRILRCMRRSEGNSLLVSEIFSRLFRPSITDTLSSGTWTVRHRHGELDAAM